MEKIIVRVSSVCGALTVEGAEIYINGEFCGISKRYGYSELYEVEGDGCIVSVVADGYEKYHSGRVKLYENATVVWSAMLESQTRSKNEEKT